MPHSVLVLFLMLSSIPTMLCMWPTLESHKHAVNEEQIYSLINPLHHHNPGDQTLTFRVINNLQHWSHIMEGHTLNIAGFHLNNSNLVLGWASTFCILKSGVILLVFCGDFISKLLPFERACGFADLIAFVSFKSPKAALYRNLDTDVCHNSLQLPWQLAQPVISLLNAYSAAVWINTLAFQYIIVLSGGAPVDHAS